MVRPATLGSTLVSAGKLDRATTRQVGEFFSAAHGRLEEMLHQTSNLLAALTNNAGVVVGPRAEQFVSDVVARAIKKG